MSKFDEIISNCYNLLEPAGLWTATDVLSYNIYIHFAITGDPVKEHISRGTPIFVDEKILYNLVRRAAEPRVSQVEDGVFDIFIV